jgi:hypothetical protein
MVTITKGCKDEFVLPTFAITKLPVTVFTKPIRLKGS